MVVQLLQSQCLPASDTGCDVGRSGALEKWGAYITPLIACLAMSRPGALSTLLHNV